MILDASDKKNIQTAGFYFLVSTLITWWFIDCSPMYTSIGQKILSCTIAGTKWTIQIVFAIALLQGKRWIFLRHIGLTCLTGSLILVPYSLSTTFGHDSGSSFFLSSLIVSVAVMIVSYFISVRKTNIPLLWWAGWMFCLMVAITLQLKVVFNMSIF